MNWTSYKSLNVPSTATDDAGLYLTADLKTLADSASYQASADPIVNDDVDDHFLVGSDWFNTSTLTMWVLGYAFDPEHVEQTTLDDDHFHGMFLHKIRSRVTASGNSLAWVASRAYMPVAGDRI